MASSKAPEVSIILAPFAGGQQKPGVDKAPNAIIEGGLLDRLSDELNCNITTDRETTRIIDELHSLLPSSNDPPHPDMRNPRLVSQVAQRIAQQVYLHASERRTVLTLGGDCSVKFGTIAGTAKAMRDLHSQDLSVVYVDAHADINTPDTSLSGNMHGMPLAFLTGIAESSEKGILDWLTPEHRINVKKLVYIAVRDVDDAEQRFLDEYEIKVFGMEKIRGQGIDAVMQEVLGYLGPDTKIHLSWDIDAFDPEVAPSTGFPTAGGLSLEEGTFIAKRLGETERVVAVDLSEINPEIGTDEDVKKTLQTGIEMVRAMLENGHSHAE